MARAKASGGAGKASPAAKRQTLKSQVRPVEDYEHSAAKRVNNPPAGLAHLDRDETPTREFFYDPHLDPTLQWAGKVERPHVAVPAPSIHVQEELSTQKIVESVRRQRSQQPLFDLSALDPAKAVEFYQHELDWSNRMILGDSLIVMTSLLERERLAGQVQCIYIDPPYGISFDTNFQTDVSSKTGGSNGDGITREPEMVRAYRDTWELEIHSYLTYLRDRLAVARDLLTDSGSVFVQIGPDNLHLAKILLDEVFGADNAVATITWQKTSTTTTTLMPEIADFICWYAKDKSKVKFRGLYLDRREEIAGTGQWKFVEMEDGTRRAMTDSEKRDPESIPPGARVFRYDNATSPGYSKTKTVDLEVDGKAYHPGANRHWLLRVEGMQRLAELGRLAPLNESVSLIRYADESGLHRLTNVWTDTVTGGGGRKGSRYIVESNPTAIARAVLSTTDPGDLVLDPTCGSGTTAYVCEKFGRRWITIDTSRVALAIARERLLTMSYDYYKLRDESAGVDGGFIYKSQPWVRPSDLGYDAETLEDITLYDQPEIDRRRVRVSGPFTLEALSRYSTNEDDLVASVGDEPRGLADHVEFLLDALQKQGIPRPGGPPLRISALKRLAVSGALQAEGLTEVDGEQIRFAVSLGPRFGQITMAQVSDALAEAIGFKLVVFAGIATSPEAQAQLGTGKVGGMPVALLAVNADVLVGDLLKTTKGSQTFRLYASPDVTLIRGEDGFRIKVEGVDSFDASTGQVTSFGTSGVQAWFLDDAYDGAVFRVSQAFFPVANAWENLSKTLRGTVDADLVEQLHGWESFPFGEPETQQVAVRVIARDGNASERVLQIPSPSAPGLR